MPKKQSMAAVVALALGLLVGACNPNPQPAGLTAIPTLAAGETVTLVPALQPVVAVGGSPVPVTEVSDKAQGAPTFLLHCPVCHGVQGEGTDSPPLRNSQFIQTAGDTAIAATIADGRPNTEMPAWLLSNGGPLTEMQIGELVAYLHTLQGVAAVPPATPLPPEPTEAPPPPNAPTPEPARPSLPGGPGPAASLKGDSARGVGEFGLYCARCHGPQGVEEVGAPNPGSDDGIVPELNPIDPTIANPYPKIFAANLDLFIQHGSVPSGPSPLLMMPPFGDDKLLAEQQIADVIAYVIALNGIGQ
jgi:mono/diheme cytochrome c family protein